MTQLIKNVNVNSSMIKTVGYIIKQQEDGTIEHKMRVLFNNDSVYDYKDVPLSIYNRLISANSVGKAFNVLIREQFEVEQLTA